MLARVRSAAILGGLCAVVAAVSVAAPGALADKSSKSSINLHLGPGFAGTVKASKACRAKRVVKIIDAATGARLAKLKTNSKGRFHAPSSFSGRAYARLPKKGDCKKARSAEVDIGRADLGLRATVITSTFTIVATNLGPSDAHNVVIDARITQLGNPSSTEQRSIPSIPAGGSSTVQISTVCFTPRSRLFLNASVHSDTLDPNSANNTARASFRCP
jgi:hypothetical protein